MRFLSAVLLLTLTLPWTPTLHGAERSISTADDQRPVVLVVHGRGYLGRDSAVFRRESWQALRHGAFHAAGDSLLAEGDVRVVWYADLLDARRRDAVAATGCRPGSTSTASADSPASMLGMVAMLASAFLDANAKGEQADEAHGLAGDLRFFGDPSTRCAAEERLAAALTRAGDEGRPVVLVAHSLGALVSWRHLQHRGGAPAPREADIRRLVTFGSPLGSDDLRQLMLLGEDAGSISLPRGVRSWVNVVNEDDPFAIRLMSEPTTGSRARASSAIVDVVTRRDSPDPHELRGYLRDASAARAVVGAWCDAFRAGERAKGCSVLPR